jgi:hypothetical protein
MLAKTQAIGEMGGETQAIGQEGRREAKPTPRDRVRHEDEGFFLDRWGETRRRGREAPTGKRQAEAWWREVEKEGALAMAGVREREASAGMKRAEGQAAAKAQAAGGHRGRNAQAPTWPLLRRKTGGSRRRQIGTRGWDANLGRG